MATPTSKQRKQTAPPSSRKRPADIPSSSPEVVDPVWLLKAIGLTVLAAFICGYITLCLLFYQGQWQFVLHPSRTALVPAALPGVASEVIHFGIDESGTPQLTGIWIASAADGRYAAYTIVYLPSGDGSFVDSKPALAALHSLGINLFAFDYRGYGQSAMTRPNSARMAADAASAWDYLAVSRAISADKIIAYGTGVGGALAVQLAAQHSSLPAVIIDHPRPDLLQVVLADPRTRMLPVRALFHDRFEIAAPLARLKTPKLFLVTAGRPVDQPFEDPVAIQSMTDSALNPKTVASLHPADRNGPIYLEQIKRFLEQYLH